MLTATTEVLANGPHYGWGGPGPFFFIFPLLWFLLFATVIFLIARRARRGPRGGWGGPWAAHGAAGADPVTHARHALRPRGDRRGRVPLPALGAPLGGPVPEPPPERRPGVEPGCRPDGDRRTSRGPRAAGPAAGRRRPLTPTDAADAQVTTVTWASAMWDGLGAADWRSLLAITPQQLALCCGRGARLAGECDRTALI